MAGKILYAFRITHIDNIQHVAQYGIVRANSPLRNPNFVSIGDRQIIKIREEETSQGYRLSEYIPFYFGPRSPMLYVIQNGYNGVSKIEPEKIVYCVIKLEDLINSDIDCVFTDGHAISNLTRYYGKDKLQHIDNIIKYEDVFSKFWNSEADRDLKRRKEAELLVKNDLPVKFVRGYAVFNDKAQQDLMDMGIPQEQIVIKRGFYF